jgi:tetratricopeptide (TPR) repeat protein
MSSDRRNKLKKYYSYLVVTVIVCLSIGVYWNSLNNEFVNMDDLDLIVQNTYIKALNFQNIRDIFTPGLVGAYQPVRTFSYAIDYWFWKLNPMGYHITNILCHACNTLLVFLIAYRLTKSRKQSPLEWGQGGVSLNGGQGEGLSTAYACLAALFFAVHPVHVEAVTWLSGRRDVLSSAFALLSFYCFLQFLSRLQKVGNKKQEINAPSIADCRLPTANCQLPTALFYILSLVLFALGLLTKSSVVVLPVLLILYDVCFLLPPFRLSSGQALYKKWRRILYYIPFCLVDLIFIIIFVSLSRASGVAKAAYHGGNAYTTFLTMLRVFAEYISMLFVPRNLSLTYGIRFVSSIWDLSFLAAIGVLTIVFVLTLLAWKKAKLMFFGVCWFFIGLIPVSNIIPIGIVKADRYLYLPSVGFCLVLAWLIVRGWTALTRKMSPKFILPGSAKFILQKSLPIIYWLIVAIMVFSYAQQTIRRNRDWKNSETLWTATLETTPTSTIALNNLGLIYAERGMYDKALALYEQVLAYDPNQHKVEQVYANMADVYIGKQMFDQAIDSYQKALEINPEYENAYLGLGRVSIELGQYDKAARIYQLALELNPQSAAIYNQLGNLSFVQGNYDEALAHYQKAIKLNQFYIAAYNGLGLSYTGKGEIDNALSIYQQALRIDPDATVVRNSLGSLYMNQGEIEEAIFEFKESVKREPRNAEVRNNLGMLLLRIRRYEESLQELMAALKLQPDNPKIMSNLGLAYAHVGLYEQAIQMCRWALQIDPSLFRAHVLLGDVCFGTKDFSCAIEAYQNALQLQSDNHEVREKLQLAKEHQRTYEK